MKSFLRAIAFFGFAWTAIAAEPGVFRTDSEAIESAREQLEKTTGLSASEIYAAFRAKAPEKAAKSLQSALDQISAKSGELVRVDVCLVPRPNDRLRRAGFMLTYERGLVFIDAIAMNLGDEWKFINFKLYADPDIGKVLRYIPAEFFNE